MKNMIKNYSKLEEVDIKSIHTDGWLKNFLKNQESGLTGHLDEIGEPFSNIGWDRPTVTDGDGNETPHWWPYEQTAYWTDGLERCGQLLDSEFLLDKSGKSIEYSLNNIGPDGFIGPAFLKENTRDNKWPLAVFFRCLMARYSATHDEKIVNAITNHYLNCKLDYTNHRDVINVEAMLWAYLHNGNSDLLKSAIDTYEKYNLNCPDDTCDRVALSDKKPYEHGVTYNEYSKLGAIMYICTGDEKYLNASVAAYKKIDKYFMLASGLHCSNEYLRSNNYMQSHETCDVSDYTWSLGYLLMATGKASYADKIEKCVLNAGMGCIDEEFRALQYFSCPNQLISNGFSNHNVYNRGNKWMAYRQIPGTQCCPGNVNRFFPNHCSRMWMQKDGCIYAVFYGAGSFENDSIKIIQTTDYPFEDSLRFDFRLKNVSEQKFGFRVPGWCNSIAVKLNGNKIKVNKHNGFAKVTVADGDCLEVELSAEIKIKKYGKNGTVVSRGPLVYSLGMYGRRVDSENDKTLLDGFPVKDFYPDKPWNYALISDNPDDYTFEREPISADNPWDIRNCCLKIRCPAVKLDNWDLERYEQVEGFTYEDGVHPVRPFVRNGNYLFTPHFPKKGTFSADALSGQEIIELVPLGLAKLRLTVFLKI